MVGRTQAGPCCLAAAHCCLSLAPGTVPASQLSARDVTMKEMLLVALADVGSHWVTLPW